MASIKYRPFTLGFLALHAVPVLAEETPVTPAPEPEQPSPAAAPAQELEEVTVRARFEAPYKVEKIAAPKYTAPLLDTPKTVNVIPEAVIQESGATSLTEALRMTPGITLGAGEGGNPTGDRPFIRGYDSQSSTFVDGMRDIGSQSREVFNLEQIEVVKGPNGAADGRGAPGGSINLATKTAKADEFMNTSLGLGTDNYKRATFDGNWKLNDNSAFRFNAMTMGSDVAGRDAVNYSRWGVAPSLALGLNTPTRVTLSLYMLRTDELPDSGIPYNNPFGASSPSVGLNGNGAPVIVDRNAFYGLVSRDFRKTGSDIASVVVEHDLSDAVTLRQTLRYTGTNQDYVLTQPDDSKGNILLNGTVWRRANTRISNTDTIASQTDFSGTFKLADMQHSFSTGIEFSDDKGSRHGYTVNTDTDPGTAGNQNTCPPAQVGAAGNYNCTNLTNPNPWDPWAGVITPNSSYVNIETTSSSLYFFDTVTLTEQWLVNAGVRYDNYESQTVSSNPTATPTPTYSRLETSDGLFNYQLGVVFKPTANGSVYLSHGTSSTPVNSSMGEGSESQSLTVTTKDLAPEENTSLELGTKWDLLDNNVSLTGAIFRMETENSRVTSATGTAINAGTKKIEGLELGVSGNLTDSWQVMAGYTQLRSKLLNSGAINTGTTAAPVWVVGLYDGNEFPNTPERSASLWTTYKVLPSVTIGGGANYMSRVWGNTANTKWVPSYTRFDAMASFAISKNLDLQLNIQNLTDKVYFDKAYASHYANIAPGRSGTLTLNLKY